MPTSHGGRQLPTQLHFIKFVCQNERIGTLRGRPPGAPLGSATEVVGVSSERLANGWIEGGRSG